MELKDQDKRYPCTGLDRPLGLQGVGDPRIYIQLTHKVSNFIVAQCINNIKHFIVQLTHTNYKILRL